MNASLEGILELASLAGETMLKNGGETYRVEATMEHIARACGCSKVESFVIPTGLFLTVVDQTGRSLTAIRRVRYRTINLDRIAKVNELSRRLVEQRINFNDASAILQRISRERTGFSLWPSVTASGMIGAGMGILIDGGVGEVVAAFMGAASVRYIAHVISRLHAIQFTYQFLGGMVAAALGILTNWLWPQVGKDIVIIGGIMPLVPGMAITNAIRDIIAGDLLSGLSLGMEAALTSVAVAMGVVIVLAV